MKKELLLATGLFLATSGVGFADDTQVGGYVGLKTGVSNIHVNFDKHYHGYKFSDFSDGTGHLGIAGGALFKNGSIGGRAELEYLHYFEAEDKITVSDAHYKYGPYKIKITGDSIFANGYFDIYPTDSVNLYLTAGLGISWIDAKLRETDLETQKNGNFSWKTGAGVMFNLLDDLSIDVGYRFTSLDSESDGDVYSHDINAGFTFKF